MRPTSLRSERLILADPNDVRLRQNSGDPDRFLAAVTSPEVIGLAIFCMSGLLLTAVFALLVPNFAQVAASLQPMF